MKKLAFLVLGVVGLSGCTKTTAPSPVCDVLFAGVTAAAQGVATALDCTNVPAIAGTLSGPIANLNMCQNTPAGLIGDLVCPQVAKAVLGIGLSQLPPAWGCKGGDVGDKAKDLLETKCKESVAF